MEDTLHVIAEYLKANDDYMIITHVSPDGDAIGSALALGDALKMLNKRVQVVTPDIVPKVYRFLPGADEVINYERAVRAETVITVDCADKNRLGRAAMFLDMAKHTISIDHHMTNTMYAEHNEVQNRAANAEIILDLIEMLGCSSKAIADCLYNGIMTDTGCFAFSNVTSSTFRAAAKLVEMGANTTKINQEVYRSVPFAQTKLLGFALSNIELYESGKIGLFCLNREDMLRCGAQDDDTEGIVDHIRDIETVEAAIFVRECMDGDMKVSMRSKNYIDVAAIAQLFGGGGHKKAAGIKTSMDRDTICDMLISAIAEKLR